MARIDQLLAHAPQVRLSKGRPLVTLCYAQSLDGSIAARRGQPLVLSGTESFTFAHRMRAAHQVILVGIGTVLADDPQLNVRLVEGAHPQPLILDSHLLFPLSARLLTRPGPKPWIACAQGCDPRKRVELEAAGARLLTFPLDSAGRLDLPAVLAHLAQEGVDSVMAEGGAKVIGSLLCQRLADLLVMTIAPVFVGGLRALEQPLFPADSSAAPLCRDLPQVADLEAIPAGKDLILTGRLVWETL